MWWLEGDLEKKAQTAASRGYVFGQAAEGSASTAERGETLNALRDGKSFWVAVVG